MIVSKDEQDENMPHVSEEAENIYKKKMENLSSEYIDEEDDIYISQDYENGNRSLSVLLNHDTYHDEFSSLNNFIIYLKNAIKDLNLERDSYFNRVSIGIESVEDKNSFSCRIVFSKQYNQGIYTGDMSSSPEEIKMPYSISAIAYDSKETKWIKKVYKAILRNKLFVKYDVDYKDYSEYYIY